MSENNIVLYVKSSYWQSQRDKLLRKQCTSYTLWAEFALVFVGSLQTCHCSLLMYLNAQSHLHRQTEHLVRPNVAFVPFPCWRQDVNHPPPPPVFGTSRCCPSELFIRTINGLTCVNKHLLSLHCFAVTSMHTAEYGNFGKLPVVW